MTSSAGVSGPPNRACQPRFERFVAQDRIDLPARGLGGKGGAERLDELFGGELGRVIARVGDAEKGGAARQLDTILFCGVDAGRVVGVFLQRVEMDAADRILDVELVLESVGDGIGAADDQQVVGNLVGIGRARAGAMTGQEAGLGVLGAAVAVRAFVELEVTPGLVFAERDEVGQGLLDRRVGVVGEDDPPAGLIQLLGVDPFLDAQCFFGLLVVPEAELVQVLRLRFAPNERRQLGPRHGRQAVVAGGAVDAVEVE